MRDSIVLEDMKLISMTVLTFLLILIGSFAAGLLFTYTTSVASKEKRKKQIDALISMVINLVIYIWIGKILANLSLFIQDPFAVLAYPSNGRALAIALVLLTIHIFYKVWFKKENMMPVVIQLLPVFIASAFMYEFLQMTVMGNKSHWMQVLLYAVLLLIYVLLQEGALRNWIIIYSWLIIQLFFTITKSYTTVFQYSLSLTFIIVLFIVAFIGLFLQKRLSRSMVRG